MTIIRHLITEGPPPLPHDLHAVAQLGVRLYSTDANFQSHELLRVPVTIIRHLIAAGSPPLPHRLHVVDKLGVRLCSTDAQSNWQ